MLETKFFFGITSGLFLGQDIHFAIYLFAALACFAAGWLYFDAWTGRHHLVELFKWAGFFLLAVGLLVGGAAWDSGSLLDILSTVLQLLGYLCLTIGNLMDPLQPVPKNRGLAGTDPEPKLEPTPTHTPAHNPAINPPAPRGPSVTPTTSSTPASAITPSASASASAAISIATPTAPDLASSSTPKPATNLTLSSAPPATPAAPTATSPSISSNITSTKKTSPAIFAFVANFNFSLPVAAFIIAGLYWRRATIGLERHLKPIARVFLALGLANAFALAKLWRTTDNPLVQTLVNPLGLFWVLEHLALLSAGIWLILWVWRYLTKRFLTQLFLTMTTFTVTIVLVATVSITGLLLTSLQKDALASLETAAKVLSYAVSSKTAETRSNATVLAQNPATATAIASADHATLTSITNDLLVKQQLSDVIVTDSTGQVLIRASDPDRYGDSLSDDSLVRRALIGTTASSIASRSGVLAPELLITTASPIRASGRIVGVALASLALDNSFVDGIKHTTNLDSAVYAGDTRAATTLVGPDGTSRSVGAKETNQTVLNTTLKQGQVWHGSLSVSNQAFLAVYLPLKDVDNTVVGMLFVGQLQDTILHSAQDAIKLTFASAVVWLLIIMLPIYFISKRIDHQLH